MKKLILGLALALGTVAANAQTVEELKTKLAEKNAQISKLQGEAGALQTQIDAFPGWKFGTSGTIGANFSGFNDWYTNSLANSNNGNVGISFNGFANLDREKYFWRNSLNINLGWTKLDDTTDNFDADYEPTTDVFAITSLFGYKLNDKWAASALAEYRTAILRGAFNDPGYLDIGVGATWTPIPELVVVIHPLNYNFVFSDGSTDFESSLGAKVVADYNKTVGKFKFRSNLSAFLSYKDTDLSNWTWINSLGFNLWKGIGVGIEGGLRGNKQETYNLGGTGATSLADTDTDIQSY